MKISRRPMVLSGILILFITLACTLTSQTPQVIVVTSTPLPQEASPTTQPDTQAPTDQPKPAIITPTPEPQQSLLPKPVYYLAADSAAVEQVWYLDVDGKTTRQITHSEKAVSAYDISTANGLLAYISDNTLYVQASADEAPLRILQDKPRDDTLDFWYQLNAIDDPVWSHDGSRLAFYHGGLNLFTPADGSIQTLLENNLGTNTYHTDFEGYAPLAWSPDDTRLVLSVNRYEGGPMGLYSVSDGSLKIVTKGNGGYPCCSAVWKADGSQFYVAGYEYGSVGSDFWVFDGKDGTPTELIPGMTEADFFNFCFFPTQIGDTLYFFHTESSGEDAGVLNMHLVTSSLSAPAQMTILRGDVPTMDEALWAPDASFALVLERQPEVAEPWPGTLFLISTNNQPIVSLVSGVHDIKWGY